MTGLEPRGFRWVIAGRLAVSERIGGSGFQHRRVRREEEIAWLKEQGIDTVLSLLPASQNRAAYEAAGFTFRSVPVEGAPEEAAEVEAVFEALDELLAVPHASVLMHRDSVDDVVAGILAGYLIHASMLDDPIIATSVIQEIIGRPMGPEGRRLIPASS
ncbi:MAG TPA: hypothetical protein ENK55_07250 [Actinobacteria bacterium]|nr:hypothetical protein [Actinomycetota bacterium]